jgi:mannose-6-phosphate isomerase-like protein (cupin superfamily)
MNASRRATLVGLAILLIAPSSRTGAASKWTITLNETRGPIRAADTNTPLGREMRSEVLAGPTNGSDNGYVIFTRTPGSAHGPSLFTLPDDHLYLVLEGRMSIQIGTDTFVVNPYEGVQIPANTPHEVWNAAAEPEAHIEVIAPGSSRDLLSMLTPARPRKVENAAQYIRTPKVPAQADLKPGLNGATFVSRQTGSTTQMRIDSTLPGAGGPRTHIHKFVQVYFSIEGQTTVEYGLNTYPLPKYSIAVIQPGVVHTNYNRTAAIERHVVLLMPQPESGPLDVEYERKGAIAQ